MYHFVYETVNLINGKKYIGKHSTENLNDSYLGSGVALNRAIKKYGEESFKRSIIKQFETSAEALEYEAQLVTEDLVKSNEYYNMRQGGEGGRYKYTEADKAKMSNSAKERIKRLGHNLLGKHRSEETKRKLSETNKRRYSEDPTCHGRYGTGKPKIDKIKGPKNPTTLNKICVNNGKENRFISAEDPMPEGFVKGMVQLNRKSRKGCEVKPTTTGRIWVNNGAINKLVNPLSIPDGYVKGRLR
ncbi:GIY-YIG nuclease family protein [Escherichia coli]|nr:GIY-YIG nuclease family protein [Escherichia coli]